MKVVTVILLTAMCALSAFASAPGLITHQGRLLNSSGSPVPDGDYTVTFTFYNASGVIRYSEQLVVQTEDGLFTALLGATAAIEAHAFSDTATFLGVQLQGQPEMTPRTRISSVPFALQAQNVLGKYDGKNRTVFYPISHTDAALYILDTAYHAQISLTQTESGNAITLRKPGSAVMGIKSLVSDDDIALTMYNLNGIEAVRISSLESGNSAARLPDSSISSTEMSNEPGLTANDNASTVVLGTAVTDVVAVTLSAPSNGYVLVTGRGTAFLSGTTGTNYGYVQIDTASGGTVDAPYRVAFGSDDSYTTANQYIPVSASRVFPVSTGNYTFRLEGRTSGSQGAGASLDVRNSMIQAIFIPTSYGTVNTIVSASDVGQFEGKEAIQVEGSTMYRVDLRELEVKAARAEAEAERARADAEKAKRELLEAQDEVSKN